MSLYSVAKKTYRRMGAPLSSVLFSQETPLSRTVVRFKTFLEGRAAHDEIYDRDYYLKYSAEVAVSAIGISNWIMARDAPGSCIDVGCGSGELLSAFARHGVKSRGYDNSEAALALCRDKGLTVDKLDLETAPTPELRGDVVISVEVAEHIPQAYADAYVHFLSQSGPVVYITAATPGQGGTDHVNEQPNAYWIEKFAAHGMAHDSADTDRARQEWRAAGVDGHRSKNLMVFRKTPRNP